MQKYTWEVLQWRAHQLLIPSRLPHLVRMKMLYGARMARPDLLSAVCKTAACATKWTEQQDIDLFRIICNLNATVDYRLASWARDGREDAWLKQFADADLA
eukprot:8152017-Pyramimonas_sp.AAC.1